MNTKLACILATIVLIVTDRLPAQPLGKFEQLSPKLPIEDMRNARHDGKVIEVAGEKHLFRTTDEGQTWRALDIDSTLLSHLRGAQWLSPMKAWSKAWAYSTDSILNKTVDGGATWEASDAHITHSAIGFKSIDTGCVISYDGRVVTTTDGGKTWSMPAKIADQFIFGHVWYSDRAIFIMRPTPQDGSSVPGGLFRSFDNGGTWDTLNFIENNQETIEALWFAPNELRAYSMNTVYTSTDNGDSWSKLALSLPDCKEDTDAATSLAGLYPMDRDRAWLRGWFDELLFTSDGGKSWLVQDTGSRPKRNSDGAILESPQIQGLVPYSPTHVIAFGVQGFLRTQKNGSWSNGNSGITSGAIFSTCFITPEVGLVGSLWGSLFRTTDGGLSWEDVSPGLLNGYVNSISILKNQVVINTLFDSSIYISTDLGETWKSTRIDGLLPQKGGGAMLLKVALVSPTHAYACGFTGNVVGTTDGGNSWRRISPLEGLTNFYDLSFVSETTGWIVGDSGKVYKTTDAGSTWQFQSTGDVPIPNQNDFVAQLHAVSFSDELHGTVAGNTGKVFVTSDGGQSWQQGTPGVDMRNWLSNGYRKLKLFPDGSIWGVVAERNRDGKGNGGITWSSDQGLSWTKDSILMISGINDISFPSKDVGYFVGANGTLVKWTSSTASVDAGPLSSNQYLDIRITPSPAQQLLNCTVYGLHSVKDHQSLRLKIFDLLGREVKDLSEEVLQKDNGLYSSISFPTSSLPSGLYIMFLTTSDGSKSQPFHVLR
jgi:photosystem II stability/assembly factor-like uncharacterized protein